MKHPAIDPRWGHTEETFTYEAFRAGTYGDFFLKPEVPEDVRGQWAVIKSLVELSYYQYEFIDLAVHKAFISLEMAIRIRHREVTGTTKMENYTMNPLIKWFFKRGYFETDHEGYIDRMVWIRNHFSHPKMHSFGGPLTSHNLFSPLHLINDLYEDIGLRKKRDSVFKELNLVFDKINRYGGIIEWANGRREIIYLVNTTFVNNKMAPATIYLSFHIPFEIPVFKTGDSCRIYPAETIDCIEVATFLNTVAGKLADKKGSFKISTFENSDDQMEFDQWKLKYNDFALATGHHLSIASPLQSRGFELITEFYKLESQKLI